MWSSLDWQAWVTIATILVMIVALVREMARPDMILLGSLGLLLLMGIVSPEQAFAGLSNSAVLTVASLFVVAAGVQSTGALSFTDKLLFAPKAGLLNVMGRIMVTTATMSAFLNNTPIVAMLIPRIQAWCEENNVPASKLMIPLSYAAILGGMTTLIGTSTNLLVSGLMQSAGYDGLGLFDLTWIALPAALVAIIYLLVVGYRLLPSRGQDSPAAYVENDLDNLLFEVRVAASSKVIGKTIEEADLRSLGDVYLVHLRRGEDILQSSPETTLQAGDELTFLGNVSKMDELLQRPGFQRATDGFESPKRSTLPIYEAVVAPWSRLVGRTLRDADFRDNYQGVVLGIQRRDQQFNGPLGSIPLKAGDLLIIEAPRGFDKRWNEKRNDFYLVAPRRLGQLEPQKEKAPIALLILFGVVATAALGIAPIVTTSFVGALAMVVTRCIRGWEARDAIDFPVLIVIASALGIGQAIEQTGLADAIATTIITNAAVFGPIGIIVAIYFATNILTEFITNNAAAALMVSIGIATARDLGIDPHAFALVIAIAASASFLTPIGYQTNLMVMTAGGYRFSDYLKMGIFVNLIVASIAITMIWWLWF